MACGGDCGCKDCGGKAAKASPGCRVCAGAHETSAHGAPQRARHKSRSAPTSPLVPSGSDGDDSAVHPPQREDAPPRGELPEPSRPMALATVGPPGGAESVGDASTGSRAASRETAVQPPGARSEGLVHKIGPDELLIETGRGKGGRGNDGGIVGPAGGLAEDDASKTPDGSSQMKADAPDRGLFSLVLPDLGLLTHGSGGQSSQGARGGGEPSSVATDLTPSSPAMDSAKAPDCECDCYPVVSTMFDQALAPGLGFGASNYVQPPITFALSSHAPSIDWTKIAVAGSITSGVKPVDVGGGSRRGGLVRKLLPVDPTTVVARNLSGANYTTNVSSDGGGPLVKLPVTALDPSAMRAATGIGGLRTSMLAGASSDDDGFMRTIGNSILATGAPPPPGGRGGPAPDRGAADRESDDLGREGDGDHGDPLEGPGDGVRTRESGGGGGRRGGAELGSGYPLRPSPPAGVPPVRSVSPVAPPLHPVGAFPRGLRSAIVSPDGAISGRRALSPGGTIGADTRSRGSRPTTVAPFGDLGRTGSGGRPDRSAMDASGGFGASSRRELDGSIRAQATSATALASDRGTLGVATRASESRRAWASPASPQSAPRATPGTVSPSQISQKGRFAVSADSGAPGASPGTVSPTGRKDWMPAGSKSSPDGLVPFTKTTDEPFAGLTIGVGKGLKSPDATRGVTGPQASPPSRGASTGAGDEAASASDSGPAIGSSGGPRVGTSAGLAQSRTAAPAAPPASSPGLGRGPATDAAASGLGGGRGSGGGGGGGGSSGNAKRDAITRAATAAIRADNATADAHSARQSRARVDAAKKVWTPAQSSLAALKRLKALVVELAAKGSTAAVERAFADIKAREEAARAAIPEPGSIITNTPVLSTQDMALIERAADAAVTEWVDATRAARASDPSRADARIAKERRRQEQAEWKAEDDARRNEVRLDVTGGRRVAALERSNDRALKNAAGNTVAQYQALVRASWDERPAHAARLGELGALDSEQQFLTDFAKTHTLDSKDARRLTLLRKDEARRRAEKIQIARRELKSAIARAAVTAKLIDKLTKKGDPSDAHLIESLKAELKELTEDKTGLIDQLTKRLDDVTGKKPKPAPRASSGEPAPDPIADLPPLPELPGDTGPLPAFPARASGGGHAGPGFVATPPQLPLLAIPCPTGSANCAMMICPVGTTCACILVPRPPVGPPADGGGGGTGTGGAGGGGTGSDGTGDGDGDGDGDGTTPTGGGGGGGTPPVDTATVAKAPLCPPGAPCAPPPAPPPAPPAAPVPPTAGESPNSPPPVAPPGTAPTSAPPPGTRGWPAPIQTPNADTARNDDRKYVNPCFEARDALKDAQLPQLSEDVRQKLATAESKSLGWSLSGRRTLGDATQGALAREAYKNLWIAELWLRAAIEKLQADGQTVESFLCTPGRARRMMSQLLLIRLAYRAFLRACTIYAAEEGFGPPPGSRAWRALPEAVRALSLIAIAVSQRIVGKTARDVALDEWGLRPSEEEWASFDDPEYVESRIEIFAMTGPAGWKSIHDQIDAEWERIDASRERDFWANLFWVLNDILISFGAGAQQRSSRTASEELSRASEGFARNTPFERPYERPIERSTGRPIDPVANSSKRPGGSASAGVPKPSVSDPDLGNVTRDLYKGADAAKPIGTGSTADAIRHERVTGEMVGGKFHTQKGEQYARALENWQRRNPTASAADRAAAQSMLDDLRSALGGK